MGQRGSGGVRSRGRGSEYWWKMMLHERFDR